MTTKNLKTVSTVALVIVLLQACIRNEDSISASFPQTPTNLTEFNTEYDDYNSTAPTLGETFPFCFSSNRNSQGNNFDIVYMLMSIQFDKDDQELSIFSERSGNLDVVSDNANLRNVVNTINTSTNEYGPYLIPRGLVVDDVQPSNRYESYIMLYSTDLGDNQEIRYTHNLDAENYITPITLNLLNSEYDDAYPSLDPNQSKLYFASNREGNFSIYSQAIDESLELIEAFENTASGPVREDGLSSSADDTCPFIIDDMMIFASDREGGFGGYDLYYSKLENGQWSAPVNFGENINSADDEFRPIIRQEGDFENDIMIFSSNRSGGLGGFDLYFVGVDQLRQ